MLGSMVIHNLCNESHSVARPLFHSPVPDPSEKPVKFKSVLQFYQKKSTTNEYQSSTDLDLLDDEMQQKASCDDWSDSQEDAVLLADGQLVKHKPVKKKKMSIIQNQVFEVNYINQSSKEEQGTFKTLAQLLEPQPNERIKSCPKKRKTFAYRNGTKRSYYTSKSGSKFHVKRCRTVSGKIHEESINLIVDLIFEKDMINDGLALNGFVPSLPEELPAEEGMQDSGILTKPISLVLNQEDSINQKGSTSLDVEEEQFVTVSDPISLTTARLSTRHVAKSISNILPFQSVQLKWREIDVGEADPSALVNRRCKVYWALENKWYTGFICEYNQQTHKHRVIYDKNDEKWHLLIKERLALHISLHEKISLILGHGERSITNERKTITEELLVLAASIEDFEGGFHHGDIVWAEDTGYPMWPAFVMGEEHAKQSGLEICSGVGTLPVHFFGSHDSARVNSTRVVWFSKGLLSNYHVKCRRMSFERGLEEVDRYFKEQKLPEEMVYLQEEVSSTSSQDDPCKQAEETENDEDFVGDERKHKVRKSLESIFKCPIKLGSLEVLSLGKIVKDSEYFHDQHYIWTEGYTAIRKFFSMKDPTKMVNYKMEILKNPAVRTMPLFRVTPDDWEQVEAASAAACWKKIFERLQKAKGKLTSNLNGEGDKRRHIYRSGAAMFGVSHPQVSRLIQALPYARVCSKFKTWAEATPLEELDGLLPAGFKHVEAEWKHLDRCSVCYTNEEYEGNVLLQCDKCRMLVHLNCYGVLETPGDSWLCNLCDSSAPRRSPPCCLCPIKGGAMKQTTDGRWVHLACALWIPETCCVDLDRMEPIDGIQSINKERWKLTCTICNVPYGACIQCADHHCRVAFHPLCARAAGFCTKVLEGLRRKRNRITGAHEEERSVQLLSYCKKHMQSGRSPSTKPSRDSPLSSDEYPYTSHNPSGCARSEPYNVAVRRGRREPEHYSAALAKRAFLENRPHIVTGCLRKPFKRSLKTVTPSGDSKVQPFLTIRQNMGVDDIQVALSTSERFIQMRSSLHQRLTFGKSAIHGWGLFAKQPHEAGDMVIEYAGEIIRPVVADVRERSCYNSLVGAGTYMFCIDNERVIDATRAGSIAHLINHSCEPNCYSRVVTACGKERIIIFAKQDIAGGEEVTYDYRFTSIGEQLTCHCGTAGCRGIVNVMDEDDDSGRILVRSSELVRWP